MSAARKKRTGARNATAPRRPRKTGTPPSGTAGRGTKRAAGHEAAGSPRAIGVALLTVSDTRRGSDDVSGARAAALVEATGHRVVAREWCADDRAAIRRAVRAALARPDCDALVVTGGTGVAPRDVTPEAVASLVQKWLPGFGELFRAASQRQVGTAAWLSRAEAGVAAGRLIVLLPGSTRAVELALTQILLPELSHVVRLLGRF